MHFLHVKNMTNGTPHIALYNYVKHSIQNNATFNRQTGIKQQQTLLPPRTSPIQLLFSNFCLTLHCLVSQCLAVLCVALLCLSCILALFCSLCLGCNFLLWLLFCLICVLSLSSPVHNLLSWLCSALPFLNLHALFCLVWSGLVCCLWSVYFF